MVDALLQRALVMGKLGSGAAEAQLWADIVSLGSAEIALAAWDSDFQRNGITNLEVRVRR
jgi:hypothetical protein